jgi:hypothetical protein
MIFGWLERLARSPLARREQPLASAWDVIAWWEARRLPFNAIIGAVGLVTSCGMLSCAFVMQGAIGEPIGMPDPPFLIVFGVVAYAIAANLCFAGGWIAELIARRVWGERAENLGEIAFTLGLVFSVLLTLAPLVLTVVVSALSWIVHVLYPSAV